MAMDGIDVEIPDEMWHDLRGDRTLLMSTLWLNQFPLHVEAVAVEETEAGLLVASLEEDEDRLEALDKMYPARWHTIEIGGSEGTFPRRYVVYAVPFAD